LLGALAVRGLNGFARGTASIGCTKTPMPKSLREAYAAPYDSWANRIAVHRFVQDIPLHPRDRAHDLVSWVEGRLHLLRSVPMFIGWGMKDFVFDETFLKEWERRFPSAVVRRYPEAGHYVLEDEAEGLIPEIKNFLNAPKSPSTATATRAAES
jgi:haloalkane dehalogenase